MGFQIGRTFELDFGEEGETDAYGAVIKMRSASIATLTEFSTCGGDREREIIAAHIVEWNLEDGGVPLPVEAESLRKLDPPFRDLIWTEWIRATRGVSAPFDRRSEGGEQSPEEDDTEPLIPMEPL